MVKNLSFKINLTSKRRFLYNFDMSMNDSNNLKAFSWLFSVLLGIQTVLFLKMGAGSLLAISGLVLLIVMINIVFLKQGKNSFPGHILNTCLLIYLACLCYKTGGFYSIAMILFFFVPLFITVFPNKKVRWLYIAVALLIFFSFYFEQRLNFGFFVAERIINISLYRLYNLFAVLICFFAAVTIYTKKNDQTRILLEQSQAECRQISKNAEQAMKIKDEFLANMSHEIRNPMNGIIGMMHVLLDSDLDEEQKKYSKIVYNSAMALLSIVNDILDLSKIEAGMLELDIRRFDLEIAIKEMVSLPQLQARQKGIDFSYFIDPDVPCLLKGDIGRIRQIINNLTGNAIKFTDSGEVTLTITLKSEDENGASLHFNVEDTGIGIKEEVLETLFESFTQADLSITKKYGGTGLGLAISKLLVEKMDGKIGAESIDMIGSTFWFTLVLKKQSEEERTIDLFTRNIDDCKVLVLSDGASLGINFEKNLNALEIDYDQAFDDTEAFEMLKWALDENTPFHVVIMEAKEYDKTAESLGKRIKQDDLCRHTELILLTSIGKEGDAKRFEKIGFSAFLSKPVEKSLLLDCIKAVLSRYQKGAGSNLPIITRYSILESKKHLRKILIVEDMETNLLTAKALIGKQGYKTDEAKNGQQAVQKHKDNFYDLILMDCQMPVMDGFEATRQIRENEKILKMDHIPIIAMTGNAFESDKKKCFDAGMDDFISKPVEPDILSQKIKLNLTPHLTAAKEKQVKRSKDEIEHSDITVEILPSELPCVDTEVDLCFNKDKLSERFGRDDELIEVVLESFFQEAPELIESIGHAMDENDAEDVRLRLHALKGSAANVNADLLRNAVLDMETEAKAENSDSFVAKFEIIRNEYERFVREAKL
ncbi:MAG: hypothetical protein DRH34_01175 [Deltaproteobacteria bacterium]|nr:MAG: hypothetical protein DRH34_01175 [Deltaproteobacteria bacterium]